MYSKAVTLIVRCRTATSDTLGLGTHPGYKLFCPLLLELQNQDCAFIFTSCKYFVKFGKALILFPHGNFRIYSGKSEVNKDVLDLEMRSPGGSAGESETPGEQ